MVSILINLLNHNKYFPYFIVSTLIYSFGNVCEQLDISNRVSSNKKKKLILIKFYWFQNLLNYKICNENIFNSLVFKRKLNTVEIIFFKTLEIILNLEFAVIRAFVIFVRKFFNIHFYDNINFIQLGVSKYMFNNKTLFISEYNSIEPYPTYAPNIYIKKNKDNLCKIIISKKIDIKKKIICLHVRDHLFHDDNDRRNFRNADVNNYIKTIKYLIYKNYTVIRLGNYMQKKIKYTHPNFFQYNFSEINSPLMDFFLIKKCFCYIGTSSGPVDLSFMFQKPTLLTNSINVLTGLPRNYQDRVLFKKIYYKNKKVNLENFIDFDFSFHDPSFLQKKSLNFVENTSNEILQSSIKFINDIEKKNNTLSKKQIIFKLKVKNSIENKFINDNYFKSNKAALRYIKWIKTFQGTII